MQTEFKSIISITNIIRKIANKRNKKKGGFVMKVTYACLKIGVYLLSFCKGIEKNMVME